MKASLGGLVQGSAPAREPASPPPLDWPEDALEVGRVVDAWGVKGWLKVQPFSDDPQALIGSRRWFIKPPESPLSPGGVVARRTHYPPSLAIREARLHNDVIVALADGIADRAAAESMRGARIFIARASFPKVGADEFYWVDLIGLGVVNRQAERLGVVVGLLDTGPHSVLRVRPDAGDGASESTEERLIPFVGAYVDDVDLEQRCITVDWGLDY